MPVPLVRLLPVTATSPFAPVIVPLDVTLRAVPVVRPLAVIVTTPDGVVTEFAVTVKAFVPPAPAFCRKEAAKPVEAWVFSCCTSKTVAESVNVDVAPIVGAALTIFAIEPLAVYVIADAAVVFERVMFRSL